MILLCKLAAAVFVGANPIGPTCARKAGLLERARKKSGVLRLAKLPPQAAGLGFERLFVERGGKVFGRDGRRAGDQREGEKKRRCHQRRRLALSHPEARQPAVFDNAGSTHPPSSDNRSASL